MNSNKIVKILKQPIGWIELDLDINLKEWQQESLKVNDYYVNHREGENHIGWQSCCLHGLDIDKTCHWTQYVDQEDDCVYKWTDLAKLTPKITQFWKSFPAEKFCRLRFMKLMPGGYIRPHNDAPNNLKNTEYNMLDHIIPINMAIFHPSNCALELENYGQVPFTEGKAFLVNITDTHWAYNYSNLERVHMIAHCVIGNRKKDFEKLVIRSLNKQQENLRKS